MKEETELKMDGFAMIKRTDLYRPDIGGNTKLVYAILLSFKNSKSGESYPSQNTVSKISGLSMRTVIRSINELVEKKVITKIESIGENNKYTFNAYNYCQNDTGDKVTPLSECHYTPVRMSLHYKR